MNHTQVFELSCAEEHLTFSYTEICEKSTSTPNSNQTQVFELSCAQREAEEHRTADSASAQESLMSVTAKYASACNIFLNFEF